MALLQKPFHAEWLVNLSGSRHLCKTLIWTYVRWKYLVIFSTQTKYSVTCLFNTRVLIVVLGTTIIFFCVDLHKFKLKKDAKKDVVNTFRVYEKVNYWCHNNNRSITLIKYLILNCRLLRNVNMFYQYVLLEDNSTN